jgi:hypothetical protein
VVLAKQRLTKVRRVSARVTGVEWGMVSREVSRQISDKKRVLPASRTQNEDLFRFYANVSSAENQLRLREHRDEDCDKNSDAQTPGSLLYLAGDVRALVSRASLLPVAAGPPSGKLNSRTSRRRVLPRLTFSIRRWTQRPAHLRKLAAYS